MDFLNQGVVLVEVIPSNPGKGMIGTAWFDMLTMTMSRPEPFDCVILSLSKDDMLLSEGLSKDEFTLSPLYESKTFTPGGLKNRREALFFPMRQW